MPFAVPLPLELRSGELVLRALGDDDWRLEYELSRVPDVPQWTFYPVAIDEESARRRIARSTERRVERVAGRYAVMLDGVPLGTAGMACVEESEPEVFYALLPQGRGCGAATRSVQALTGWLFQQGFSAVALETIAGNTASENVAVRAGFHRGGSTPGNQRGAPVTLNRWTCDAPR